GGYTAALTRSELLRTIIKFIRFKKIDRQFQDDSRMALQITLVSTPGRMSVSRASQTFNEQGGTLGRAETNTWVLPDPDKFLSSCHCEVLFNADRYYLLDLSTNGTFLNGSHEPLGKGTKAPLDDGDFFEIGDYRFSVTLVLNQPFAN